MNKVISVIVDQTLDQEVKVRIHLLLPAEKPRQTDAPIVSQAETVECVCVFFGGGEYTFLQLSSYLLQQIVCTAH